MPVNQGFITAPLGVATLAEYFGTAKDVASICKAGSINKWSKWKPTGFNPDSPSVPSTTTDTSDGYWWAVKLKCTAPKSIHSFGFDYKKPTDSSYKRLEEFIGYSQGAAPNLTVTVNENYGTTLNMGMSYGDFVTFDIPTANQYGIDYIEVFRQIQNLDASTSVKDIFKKVYPICIVGNYWCVMPERKLSTASANSISTQLSKDDLGEIGGGTEDSNYTIRSLCDGTYWYKGFELDLAELLEEYPSVFTEDGNYKITIGVMVAISATHTDGKWYELPSTPYSNEIFFPIHKCVGLQYKLTVPQSAPKPTLSIAGLSESGLRWSYSFAEKKDMSVILSVTITNTSQGNFGITVTKEITVNANSNIAPIYSISCEELRLGTPEVGVLYSFKGTIKASGDGKKTWVTGTGDTWSGTYSSLIIG